MGIMVFSFDLWSCRKKLWICRKKWPILLVEFIGLYMASRWQLLLLHPQIPMHSGNKKKKKNYFWLSITQPESYLGFGLYNLKVRMAM